MVARLARHKAHLLARRLLQHDPQAHDAYFVFGFTEYMLSWIPSALRGFVRIPGAAGDRNKAIRDCRIAAQSGWYFQEFARRTLVDLYIEAGQLADARKLLHELTAEFPENKMLRADSVRLDRTSSRTARAL